MRSAGGTGLDELLGGERPNLAASLWTASAAFSLLQYGQGARGFSEVVANGRRLWRPGAWRLPRGGPRRPAAAGGERAWTLALRALRARDGEEVLRGLGLAARAAPRDAEVRVLRALVRLGLLLPRLLPARAGVEDSARAALADLEEARRLEPRGAWAPLAAGLLEYTLRRFRRGLPHLDEAVRLAPDWAWARLLRADLLAYLRRFGEAFPEFGEAARLDPENAWAHALLGRAKGVVRDASLGRDLDRAVALEPAAGWIRAWRAIGKTSVTGEAGALEDLDRARSLDPRYDRTLAWRGQELVKAGRLREAVSELGRAARLNPHLDVTHYALASAEFRLRRPARALAALRRAVETSYRFNWVCQWRDWNHQNPSRRGTLEDLDRAAERAPRSAWVWAWRGQTRLAQGDHAGAAADLERALSLGGGLSYSRAWRGEALRRLGRWREARADFDRALERDPRCAWALAWRGHLSFLEGRDSSAVGDLSRALRLAPRAAEAFVSRAMARARLGRPEAALEDLRSALEAYPTRRWLWLWRARLADSLGRGTEALSCLDQLAALSPRPEVLACRAWQRARAGDAAGARDDASAALRSEPASAFLRALAERIGAAPATPVLARLRARLAREGCYDLAEDFEWLDRDFGREWGWRPPQGGEGAPSAEGGGRGALLLRAQARKARGDFEGALRDLQAARAGHDAPLIAECGRLALACGRPDEALAAAQSVLELEPFDPGANRLAADARLRAGDARAAEAQAARLLSLRPGLSGPRLLLSRALLFRGLRREALREAERALRGAAGYGHWGHGWRAVVLGELGRAPEAAAAAGLAMRLSPGSAWLPLLRSSLRRALGDLAGAAEDRRAALGLDPLSLELHRFRGGPGCPGPVWAREEAAA